MLQAASSGSANRHAYADTASAPSRARWGAASSENAASQPSAPSASITPSAVMPPSVHWTPAAPIETVAAATTTRPLSGRRSSSGPAKASTTGTQPMITPTVAGSVSRTPAMTKTLNSTRPVAANAGQAEHLAGAEPRQPTAGERQQCRRGQQVAQELPLGERVCLDAVRGGHQRADERERERGEQRSLQRRAHVSATACVTVFSHWSDAKDQLLHQDQDQSA